MWIDTHCHLDAAEFGTESETIAARALESGVEWIIIPSVGVRNFERVTKLAVSQPNCTYALGIHPFSVPKAEPKDVKILRNAVKKALDDPRFVAVGEIGLDFFVPELCTPSLREKQEHFYIEQLKIAREFSLPVLLHARRSQDTILKYLRRIAVPSGIAHAFNGSFQQAEILIELGFKLGFGGAMTFTRALQIRRLATQVPLTSIVLETDAPDISPAWLHPQRNSPEQIPAIGKVLAELRRKELTEIASATCDNACQALPRLALLR